MDSEISQNNRKRSDEAVDGGIRSSIQRKSDSLLTKYFTGSSMDYKQIFAIIIPIFVDSAFIVLMAIMNTAMVSSSGVAAVSAVSMVDSINMFLVNLFVAIATGGTVIVAQYKGRGNGEMVAKSASQAISSVAIVSVVIAALIIVFHASTLNALFGNADADVLHHAKIFLIGSCISYPFIAIYQAVTGVLRGVAETKACLVLSLILNVSYFLLNVILIKMFDMGVIGLSISLILARVLGMVVSMIYLFKYNQTIRIKLRDTFLIHWSILKKILYIGIPFAMEQMFFNGGKLLTQTFIVHLGTLAITVNAISNSLTMLFQIGGTALSVAIVTVVGQCMGRRDIEDARKFIKSFIGLSTIFFVIITVILLLMFPMLVKLYAPPKEIVPSIFALILLIAIAQPIVWSFSFIMPSALRAAGDSKFTSIASLLSMWLFRIILGYILGITLGFGLMGVWVAMVAEWGVRGIIFAWRFRGDKWYRHKLI
ncbi:MATE family efflux transporter [Paenibacillus paeoniae]|uniref:Probable multidrug resistance protein NorM n=2 Tax=Paenibacillus paeoniae TaxID=2292705 RepID=A0A371PNT9_9BACL|nr:MATE family efflux transporter [Paenibacillus paeoniae]REK77595.1 MATE family efflux transporter [Paenibacillus paeoniae]